MQCLYVTGAITNCPLKRGFASGRLKTQCLYAVGTISTEVTACGRCPFTKVRL